MVNSYHFSKTTPFVKRKQKNFYLYIKTREKNIITTTTALLRKYKIIENIQNSII